MNRFKETLPFLSAEWKLRYEKLLHDEHLESLENNLIFFKTDSEFLQHPYFNEEIKEDLKLSFNYFEEAFSFGENKTVAERLEEIHFKHWLLILGQRLTSASERDEKAIPPLKENLLKSCLEPYNSEITVAQRAWEKHIDRLEDEFWGKIKGNNKEKQEKMMLKINEIIETKTWWNIFFHYKQHGLVYEIREKYGHGIRWTADGNKLIGFLEPFIND